MVGSRRGLEAELLAGTGLPVTLLPGPGLLPLVSAPRRWWPTWGRLAGLAAAFVAALVVVVRRRPAVVVAMGGYACVPTRPWPPWSSGSRWCS